MDVTIVNVALPAIQHDLKASLSQLQWVVDAYTLVVASLLMLSGSMADRVGRRKVFQVGMAAFSVGSLLCSVAPNIQGLILFRVVQGLGASMLNPVAMAIITNTFQDRKKRAFAIGLWGAVAGLSFAVGPIAGGALTQSVGWRSVFWINLPIGLAAMGLAARYVPESKAPRARRVDLLGQLFMLLLLAGLTSAVIEGPQEGWSSPLILGLFATAGAALVGLVVYEPRRQDPLLDLRFFGSIPFSAATVIAVCAFSSFSGFLFLNVLYLQQVRGLSALDTGLYTLPLAAMIILWAPISGRMVGRWGTMPSLLGAGGAIACSGWMLTRLEAGTPLPLVMVAYAIFGIGFGLVNAPITNTAVSGMPEAQAGVAAAVASTSRQVGAALGVAVGGTIARTAHESFTLATQPVWWIVVFCGIAIVLLGWLSNTSRAKSSVERVAEIFGA
jgi:EmrB/QacA subfamily drug resistance transporter